MAARCKTWHTLTTDQMVTMVEFSTNRSLREVRDRLLMPFTLPSALRDFFRDPVNLDRLKDDLKREIEQRGNRFLNLAETEIYARENSPYLRLLRMAGCTFSDLRAGIGTNGLEATLSDLAANGVYLTDAEFKGKTDVVRSGGSFRCRLEDFEPIKKPRGFLTSSSGTTGKITSSFNSLPWIGRQSMGMLLFAQAHGLLECRNAMLDTYSSGSHGLFHFLSLAKAGIAPDRRFARDAPASALAHAYHKLIADEVARAGQRHGPGFPTLEILADGKPDAIVEWAADHHRNNRTTCIRAVASSSAYIARAAHRMGVSLEGTTFIVSGEPMTTGKQKAIERAGAKFAVTYGFTPGSIFVGLGCAHRRHIDEMHIDEHMLAVIEHPKAVTAGGQSVRPLLITTLEPSERYLRLNTENGDYATLERRACGCPLGEVGMTHLIHHVGSHEKFTSEGLNYDFSQLFDFVEVSLPAEFGGSVGDYQILEEEDADGHARLSLLVHPHVGTIDEQRLHARFVDAIEQGSAANQGAAQLWDRRGTIRVRRAVPLGSTRGKVLPMRRRAP